MELYGQYISRLDEILTQNPTFQKPYREEYQAAPGEKNAVLFRGDTAYELGGSGKADASGVLFTSDFVPDEVMLYGRDLNQITGDCVFGHITVVGMISDDENLYYEDLASLAFDVSKIYAKGYQIRLSPGACREQVRVAKDVISGNSPLSFYHIGCSLIAELKKNPKVISVKTVFITAPETDFKQLSNLCFGAKKVTDAVKSALNLTSLDCASCKMKPICDEVEGLRELHFKQNAKK